MMRGLCESPLTFQAIIIWRDQLNDGDVLLRDIIDLEATYSGPDAQEMPKIDMIDEVEEPNQSNQADGEDSEDPEKVVEEDHDDEENENNLSLAAMELALKDQVSSRFNKIAKEYANLEKLKKSIEKKNANTKNFTASEEKNIQKFVQHSLMKSMLYL